MNKELLNSFLVLLGALIYCVIFWCEKLGLNVLVYATFLIGALYLLRKDAFSQRNVQLAAFGMLFTAILVVTHNSLIAKAIHFLSVGVLVGLSQLPAMRFILYAFLMYIVNFFEAPIQALQSLMKIPSLLSGKKQRTYGFSSIWLSVLIVPIFYMIYYFTNQEFAAISDTFWGQIGRLLSFDWNFARIFFFIMGIVITGAALWNHTMIDFSRYTKFGETLNANEQNNSEERTLHHYKSGLVLLLTLNCLLLFNNGLDIVYVWGKMDMARTSSALKEFVHSGTYILIVSILMAIAVVNYVFRGSVNFMANNQKIKYLGYAWLAQNAFLVLTVACRNWQYIDQFGLAYKRIGVFIFLILVLAGLWFMALKIRDKRNLFYVNVRMAWAIYAVLVLTALVPWDKFITQYNINAYAKNKNIDLDFLVNTISDKNLGILYQNQAQLQSINQDVMPSYESESYNPKIDFAEALDRKRKNFVTTQNEYSIWSWNWPDYNTRKEVGGAEGQ